MESLFYLLWLSNPTRGLLYPSVGDSGCKISQLGPASAHYNKKFSHRRAWKAVPSPLGATEKLGFDLPFLNPLEGL